MKKTFFIFLFSAIIFQVKAQIFIEANLGTNKTQTNNFDYFVYDSQSLYSGIKIGYNTGQYSLCSGLTTKSVHISSYNANVNYYSIPLNLIYESKSDIGVRVGIGYKISFPYKYQEITKNKYTVSSLDMLVGLKLKISEQNSIYINFEPFSDFYTTNEAKDVLTRGLNVSFAYRYYLNFSQK